MKKIYLLALAGLCAFAADAIELSFLLGNRTIAPGETVEFNDITVTDEGTYKEVRMEPEVYLTTNIYSSSIEITAACTSGQSIQMCAGGLCNGGETVTKSNVTVRTGEKFPLKFDYVGELDLDEEVPVVTTTLSAEDKTEPGSRVEFILVMGEKGASLAKVESTGATLAAVAGGIAYSTATPATLTVVTPDGAVAFSATVSGTGAVSLPAGLYIATLASKTTKLLVK